MAGRMNTEELAPMLTGTDRHIGHVDESPTPGRMSSAVLGGLTYTGGVPMGNAGLNTPRA